MVQMSNTAVSLPAVAVHEDQAFGGGQGPSWGGKRGCVSVCLFCAYPSL